MTDRPIDILSFTCRQFCTAAATRGISAASATRLYRAVFRGDGLADLPTWIALPDMPVISTRRELEIIKIIQSIDDRLACEAVILPSRSRVGRERRTLCVSCQVGCAMGCAFCETGQMGLEADLTAAQIVAQWRAARFELASPIDNIVFMGMGEPMDNLDAVIQAIRIFADRNGPAIAAQRITISTVGRGAGIDRLAAFTRHEGFRRLGLAVSINAPNDAIRSRIMPINRVEPMDRIMEAMVRWPQSQRTRVLIEYVVIEGVNDAPEHADELIAYLSPLRCTVNVVPYNPRRDSPWPAPSEANVQRFLDRLIAGGQLAKRRLARGSAIAAACGQLGDRRPALQEAGRPDQ